MWGNSNISLYSHFFRKFYMYELWNIHFQTIPQTSKSSSVSLDRSHLNNLPIKISNQFNWWNWLDFCIPNTIPEGNLSSNVTTKNQYPRNMSHLDSYFLSCMWIYFLFNLKNSMKFEWMNLLHIKWGTSILFITSIELST